jgi:hypothetical protein
MDTFTITKITDELALYTREDGSSFLTSPSLRDAQMTARDRQARGLGPEIRNWDPVDGSTPANGYATRWHDGRGWVAVCLRIRDSHLAPHCASLPDLPASVDHPVFEANPIDPRNPIIVGGNRSARGELYLRPTSLGMGCGIFFHTRHLNTYRDGGSWTIGQATLVIENASGRPHYSWGRDGEVTRSEVRVVAPVEWIDDPARPAESDGRPVIISQREIIVCHSGGRLQRIRLSAMHGQLRAPLAILVVVEPESLTDSESKLLAGAARNE